MNPMERSSMLIMRSLSDGELEDKLVEALPMPWFPRSSMLIPNRLCQVAHGYCVVVVVAHPRSRCELDELLDEPLDEPSCWRGFVVGLASVVVVAVVVSSPM